MRVFARLYDLVLGWSRHRHATRYLAVVAFTESSFFPIPPDVILAPMVLSRRRKAWVYAGLTTAASVLGGILGYYLGSIGEWIIGVYHAGDAFSTAKDWFDTYGVWVILLAGFTPVPYKIFTITAGIMSMSLIPFIVASIVGRGARFFLVAGLIVFAGSYFKSDEDLIQALRRYIDIAGWLVIGLVIILILVWL
jgi:membrane protein YqaA with SNARE-associated domain|tara:strand:+ start:977 stop:1558 length:582 start_codon:yes stop_codon:yes gene_type:complete